MIRLTQTTSFERVLNRLEDDAHEAIRKAENYRDFADHLNDLFSGLDHWLTNDKETELLSRLQDITSQAFDEADTMLARAKREMETAGDDALSMARENDQ